jgi:hypothetical protein
LVTWLFCLGIVLYGSMRCLGGVESGSIGNADGRFETASSC